ncbi:hypothetical protein [Deinococcus sp. UYEF24]
MKNQYFGDIQDYRKYGLLRRLTGMGKMSLGVIWMLTPDDQSRDGSKVEYLSQASLYRHFDPDLFDALYGCVHEDGQRSVGQAETKSLLPNTIFVSNIIPDNIEGRKTTISGAQRTVSTTDLVFFDPDNGFEISSCAKGRKNSSKYIYWDEIYRTYDNGHSVLTYQHFPRMAREEYIQLRLKALNLRLSGATVMAFCTSHVGFFLAMQDKHLEEIQSRLPALLSSWGNVFTLSYLTESSAK